MQVSSTIRLNPGQNFTLKNRGFLNKTVEVTYPGPTWREEYGGSIPESSNGQRALAVRDGFLPANEKQEVLLPGLASTPVYIQNPKLGSDGNAVISEHTESVVAPGLLQVAGSGLATGALGAALAGSVYLASEIAQTVMGSILNFTAPMLGTFSGSAPSLKGISGALIATGAIVGFGVGAAQTLGEFGKEHKIAWQDTGITHKTLSGANAETNVRHVRIGNAPEPLKLTSKKFSPAFQKNEVGRYLRPVISSN